MKIKNIFILSMMAGMTLASCNYTDLSPMDSFTDKSYWKSANDLKNTTDQLPTGATMNGGQAKRFDIWGE